MRGSWVSALAGAAIAGGLATARADTPLDRPAAIEVDRADMPPGRVELGFDGGAPVHTWGVSLVGGWLERPIAFGEIHPVRRRQSVTLGAAITLGSFTLDGRFGVAHQVGDRLVGARPRDRYVPSDLRVGARIRVAGTTDRAVFVRGDLTLPTGDDHDFAGEASWALAWRLIGRITAPGGIVIAGTAGIGLRGAEVLVGDRLVGDELLAAVGLTVPVPPVRPLWCVSDQVKLTAELHAIIGDDVGVGRSPSPVEARVGIVTRPTGDLTLGVRAGVGLVDEIGAPRYRVLVELAFQR